MGNVKLACLLFLLAIPALARPVDPSAMRLKTIQNSGPSAQKFDIVFLGDGFQAKEQSQYDAKVRSCLSILWGVSPFRELKSHFNVHQIYVDASPSGSYDARGKRQTDYPFGSTYSSDGSDMVMLDNQADALKAAASAPGADAVIVITTLSGRSHAGGLVLIADDQSALPHELGHLIAHLGDEYSSGSKLVDRDNHPLPNGDLSYANLQLEHKIDVSSAASIAKTAKWAHFLGLPDADPIVSAYQGGYYREVGVYRPSYSCLMRTSSGAIYCPVCHEEMYKAIVQKCGVGFSDKSYHSQFPLSRWKSKMY